MNSSYVHLVIQISTEIENQATMKLLHGMATMFIISFILSTISTIGFLFFFFISIVEMAEASKSNKLRARTGPDIYISHNEVALTQDVIYGLFVVNSIFAFIQILISINTLVMECQLLCYPIDNANSVAVYNIAQPEKQPEQFQNHDEVLWTRPITISSIRIDDKCPQKMVHMNLSLTEVG